MEKRINILAIDLATTTGYATTIYGIRESGVASFAVRPGEDRGWRFIRFSFWLYKWRERNLDMVVCEKPIRIHKSWAAAEVAIGFSTRVQEFCARENIPFEQVTNNQVKKYATGNGRAEKQDMVRAAQILKRGVTDHNECDALWLLDYSLRNLAAVSKGIQ